MKKLFVLLVGIALLNLCQQAYAQEKSERYFRHLRFNNVSPHLPLSGIYEMEKQEALGTSYYLFKYDSKGHIAEIINNHYHTELRHPMTTPDVYRIVFNRKDAIETRTFFNKNGKQVSNNLGVFREEHEYDRKGFKVSLAFFDSEGQPVESRWNISRYEWFKDKRLVVEKRYNLEGEQVPLAPYLDFNNIGILYDEEERPLVNYNLNDKNKVVNSQQGVAEIRNTYDAHGNLVEWSYRNSDGELVPNRWGFAIGERGYDENGNILRNSTYNVSGKLIDEGSLVNNVQLRMAEVATREDSTAIKTKSLGYLIALQELKPELMKDVMHEDLAKRTIGRHRQDDNEIIRETSYEQMIDFADSWNKSGTRFPPKPDNRAVILDIYDRSASVKLISDNWVEYLHLLKINGEWKIVNLLWQYKDVRNYAPK